MRELADHLATPIFVVDAAGDLLFYNEPAERLLGSRFDETGMLPFAEWSTMFTPTDADGTPMPPDELPLAIAVQQHRPAQGEMWIHGLDGAAPRAHRDGDPAPRAMGRAPRRGRDLLGSGMKVTLWGTRGSQASPGTGHGPLRRQHLVRRGRSGPRRAGRARRRDRAASRRQRAAAGGGAAGRPPADAPAHGPHPGPRLLRPALRARLRGPHLGTGIADRGPAEPADPIHVAAAVPGAAARAAVRSAPPRPDRGMPIDVPGLTVRRRAVCHPGPDRRLPPRDASGSLAYLPDHEPVLACRQLRRLAGVVLRVSRSRRASTADPRRAVHRRGVRRASRVGTQHPGARARVRPPRGVKQLVAFHHDPAHDDDTLDAFFAAISTNGDQFTFVAARERETIEVG